MPESAETKQKRSEGARRRWENWRKEMGMPPYSESKRIVRLRASAQQRRRMVLEKFRQKTIREVNQMFRKLTEEIAQHTY